MVVKMIDVFRDIICEGNVIILVVMFNLFFFKDDFFINLYNN